MGVISAPKDVTSTGFLFETDPRFSTAMGEVACNNRQGSTTLTVLRQIQGRGLSSHGWLNTRATNERCIADGEDILTLYGTWAFSNEEGDVLRGVHTTVVGIERPWPNDIIVTGGEGRFAGATGWIDGRVYFDGEYDEGEGMLFLPR